MCERCDLISRYICNILQCDHCNGRFSRKDTIWLIDISVIFCNATIEIDGFLNELTHIYADLGNKRNQPWVSTMNIAYITRDMFNVAALYCWDNKSWYAIYIVYSLLLYWSYLRSGNANGLLKPLYFLSIFDLRFLISLSFSFFYKPRMWKSTLGLDAISHLTARILTSAKVAMLRKWLTYV